MNRFLARKTAGEFDCLVDGHGGWRVCEQHFVYADPKDVAVDGGHALNLPVFGVPGDALVDTFQVFQHPAEEPLRERIAPWRNGCVLADEQRVVIAAHDFLRRSPAKIPLKEKLQRLLARAMTCHLILSLKLPEEICHLDGSHRRVESFVARLRPGAIDRLFHRIGGEHSEGHGNATFK